jgi:membrane protein
MIGLLKNTVQCWLRHKDARLGAALAYYSIFSMGPIIVIAIAIAGLAFGQDAVRGEVARTLQTAMGGEGARAVETMLNGVSQPRDSLLLTAIGVGTLVFAAIGVVVQLKDAFNTVWEVADPKSSGVWSFVRSYVFSIAAVIAVGFLLLTSLLLTAALSAFAGAMPWLQGAMQPLASLLSFAVIAAVFGAMFRYLPDAPVAWRDVWLGAVLTAGLFELGKFLLGFYIGAQGLESTFGAAASLVVVLIWVYYSAQIVLLGAEFTREYAARRAGATAPAPADIGHRARA